MVSLSEGIKFLYFFSFTMLNSLLAATMIIAVYVWYVSKEAVTIKMGPTDCAKKLNIAW